TPAIDVWSLQMDATRSLLAGRNPFTEVSVANTAPGMEGGSVPCAYPPTQLLFALPGRLLGAVRYSMLAAVLVTGLLSRVLARRAGRQVPQFATDAPTLFLWLSPKLYFIVEQAWIDPIQLALASLAVAAQASNRRWWSVVLFGLLFTSKQTMFWFALL